MSDRGSRVQTPKVDGSLKTPRVETLPVDLDELVTASLREGFRAVQRLSNPLIRAALPQDISTMFDIRGKVDENRMSRSELARLGFTEDVIRNRLQAELAGWVAELDGEVVGYSMSDSARGCVWAVFVLPMFQGRGIGGALLRRAGEHLFECGFANIFLGTTAASRAHRFYLRQGWADRGAPDGTQQRLELRRSVP